MITKTLEIDGEKKSVQAKKDETGWSYRVGTELTWSKWTQENHSRNLVSLQLEMALEKGQDIR